MPNFVYDLSTVQMVSLFTVILVGFTWLGTIFLRPFVRTSIRGEPGANQVVGYLLSALTPSTFQMIYDTSVPEPIHFASISLRGRREGPSPLK